MRERAELGIFELAVVAYVTVFAYSSMYAPQPLLSVLQAEFSLSEASASLIISVTLLPLSVAPLAYGFLLESFPVGRLMRLAVLLLALSEVALFLVDSYSRLLLLRFLQGLLVPAILTSLMTYVSTLSSGRGIQRTLALYIAATIFGGFFGRFQSGLISSWLGWRYSFLALAIALGLAFVLLGRLRTEARTSFHRLDLRTVSRLLRQPGFLRVYLISFCAFFVFASLLNFLPFRLGQLTGESSEFRIALMYSGYLMGIAVSLMSSRIAGSMGGEARAVTLGLLLYGAATLLFLSRSIPVLFGAMFLFCAGMFLVHSIAPGLLNRHARESKGVVNGLYIAFYYTGGTLGSYLPGFVYRHFGWPWFILTLLTTIAAALLLATGLRQADFTTLPSAAGTSK